MPRRGDSKRTGLPATIRGATDQKAYVPATDCDHRVVGSGRPSPSRQERLARAHRSADSRLARSLGSVERVGSHRRPTSRRGRSQCPTAATLDHTARAGRGTIAAVSGGAQARWSQRQGSSAKPGEALCLRCQPASGAPLRARARGARALDRRHAIAVHREKARHQDRNGRSAPSQHHAQAQSALGRRADEVRPARRTHFALAIRMLIPLAA